ncbi:hypothetical protein [Kitasatospora sp. NPDC059599]|uniref:hypothetical protein n=1 Tax=Kitasatospora sp. NPDC059599 TaxID=3346880 RepID=UPI0036C1C2F3
MPARGDTQPFDAAPLGAPADEPGGAFEPSPALDTPPPGGAAAPGAVPVPGELSPSELRALQEKLRAKFH